MKLISLFFCFFCLSAGATETIVVLNPQGPTFSGTPNVIRLLETANRQQDKYNFVLEFKPGGFESVALRELNNAPQKKISTMVTTSLEAWDRGLAKEDDYVLITSLGDFCWAVISNTGRKYSGIDNIKSLDEIVIGSPAVGGVTHLVGLELGRRYNKPVRFVPYRSTSEAMVGITANDTVNFTIDKIDSFKQFQPRNKNLEILAVSCPVRNPQMPQVKTLREYGINTPVIWQQIVAHKDMDPVKRTEIEQILNRAIQSIGLKAWQELGDQNPPVFFGVSPQTHYTESVNTLKQFRKKFAKEIAVDK